MKTSCKFKSIIILLCSITFLLAQQIAFASENKKRDEIKEKPLHADLHDFYKNPNYPTFVRLITPITEFTNKSYALAMQEFTLAVLSQHPEYLERMLNDKDISNKYFILLLLNKKDGLLFSTETKDYYKRDDLKSIFQCQKQIFTRPEILENFENTFNFGRNHLILIDNEKKFDLLFNDHKMNSLHSIKCPLTDSTKKRFLKLAVMQPMKHAFAAYYGSGDKEYLDGMFKIANPQKLQKVIPYLVTRYRCLIASLQECPKPIDCKKITPEKMQYCRRVASFINHMSEFDFMASELNISKIDSCDEQVFIAIMKDLYARENLKYSENVNHTLNVRSFYLGYSDWYIKDLREIFFMIIADDTLRSLINDGHDELRCPYYKSPYAKAEAMLYGQDIDALSVKYCKPPSSVN